MSRVAKAKVKMPAQVALTLEANRVTIKGPKGTLTRAIHPLVEVTTTDAEQGKVVEFKPKKTADKAWAHAGTARALIYNMIQGVSQGVVVTLELVGVGYRAQAAKHHVNLSLGFSHPIEFKLPEGVSAETPNNTTIVLHGIDNQLLGQVAAEIRSIRPPEPYKGKGVRYQGEVIIKKEAKKK